jgi:hypothetical protein
MRQACPNCGLTIDVKVYVSGQRVRCERCSIHFEVRRSDGSMIGSKVAVNAPEPIEIEAATPSMIERTFLRPVPSNDAITDTGNQPTALRPTPAVELPGLELIEILGRGGMGEVWRAEQKSLKRIVAVKLLPAHLAKDGEFVARFQKEATALAALSHPNIIQIIDRGVSGEQYYFVMEFVPGRSLRDVMSGGKMPPGRALKIISQICSAIDYAHEHGIVHRDLKPENILLDERGHVKVADFGLAGIRGADANTPHLTQTSVAMGTLNYMAPEQRRDAKSVDGRADLYSLGVIFYELLTGELPIGRFKLPSEKIEGLDRRLDDIVVKALDSDPHGRPDRASQISAQLEPVIAAMDSGVSQPGFTALPRRTISMITQPVLRRSALGLKSALMVVGCLAIVLTVARVVFHREVHVQKDATGLHLEIREHDHGDGHDHAGHGQLPKNTDGELLAKSTFKKDGQATTLSMDFANDGRGEPEVIHAHAGTWAIENNALRATQEGHESTGPVLIPRAYIDDRFFTSDKLSLEAQLQLDALEDDFPPVGPNEPRQGEIALRLDELQVSVIASPDRGLGVAWHYLTPSTPNRPERVGNTLDDVEQGVADPTNFPIGKAVVLRLELEKTASGVELSAYANEVRFAHKFLVGLDGQIGKVAFGCRNLHCAFNDVKVAGAEVDEARVKALASDHAEH